MKFTDYIRAVRIRRWKQNKKNISISLNDLREYIDISQNSTFSFSSEPVRSEMMSAPCYSQAESDFSEKERSKQKFQGDTLPQPNVVARPRAKSIMNTAPAPRMMHVGGYSELKFEDAEATSFGEYLQQLVNKKGMTNREVYFASNLTKQYFSKLINNRVSQPSKEKLLCIAVALKLNIDETKDFLLHAGYAISPYSKTDLVFEYYITAGKYDIYEINYALEELGIVGGLWPELL